MAKDRPSAVSSLRAVALFFFSLLPHHVAAQYPPLPSNGDVFAGSITCSVSTFLNDKGIRFTFSSWPDTAYLEIYTLSEAACYAQLRMSSTWNNYSLTLTPNGDWIHWEGCGGDSVALPSFSGTLSRDNMNFSGKLEVGHTCQTFSTVRKIGWEIRDRAAYASLKTCGDGMYQSSRVVFGCPAPTCATPPCSATQVIVPTGKEVMAFAAPAGLSNFTLEVSSFLPPGCHNDPAVECSLEALDLKFETNNNSRWVNLGVYKISDVNTTICPTGHEKLATAAACQSAAKWLRYEYGGEVNLPTMPAGCYFVPASSKVWYNNITVGAAESLTSVICIATTQTSLTFNLGSVAIACVKKRGDATHAPAISCTIPATPVTFSLRNQLGSDTQEVTMKFDYVIDSNTSQDCATLSSAGCSSFSKFDALEAVHFWSRSFRAPPRAIQLTKDEAWNLVADYNEANWAIPWYRWEAAWNKPLSPSWNGGWNDWRFAWARTFWILDLNRDGWLTKEEYSLGYDMHVPVCPAGYNQISPVILGCSARTGAEAKFSTKDPRERTGMLIPLGTTDLFINVTGGGQENVDITVADNNTKVIVRNFLPALVSSNNKNPPAGTVPGVDNDGVTGTVSFSGDKGPSLPGDNTEWVKITGTLNTSSGAPWKLSLVSTADDNPSTYLFSHKSVSGTCTNVHSGCAAYDPAAGIALAQVWGKLVAERSSSTSSTAPYTVDGLLPWYNWYQYWTTSMRGSSTGENVPLQLKSLGGSSSSGVESMFRYADENNDGYISPNEFELLQNVKVKYCDVTLGYYRNAMIVFGTSFSPNPSMTHVKCGLFGEEVMDVVVPARTTMHIATLPATVKDFKLSLNSVSVDVLINGTDGEGLLNASYNKWTDSPSYNGATFTFSVNDGSQSLDFAGKTTKAMALSIHSTVDTPTELRLTYSYKEYDNCSFPPVGCETYDYTGAKTDALAWSTTISSPNFQVSTSSGRRLTSAYGSAASAWASVKALIPSTGLLLGSIPLKSFKHVWCLASTADACLRFMRGFVYFDTNGDGVVDEQEFKKVYNVAGANTMVQKLLGSTNMPTNQYENVEFPLAALEQNEACHCSKLLGEGWNSAFGQCMKRSQSTCVECPHQSRCAAMHTAAGSGQRDHSGDCVYPDQAGFCKVASEAHLSNPVAIAIDEDNHMYIADYGNNRVRMVSATTQHIETIAGSGRVGFYGDGGPGINAQLRHPEGIAVNNLQGNSNSREVFFSDFFNQRIRVITRSGTGANAVWTINTVLGTGEKGQNSACDNPTTNPNGCPAAQAILHNPRALAFSFDQDLYIVDSGNRKIRKLTGLYTSTSSVLSVLSNSVMFSTFVGIGVEITGNAFEQSMKVHEGWFLSGHWEANNRDVALKSIFNLQVDMENNLWFADASNNRMFMAPLKQSTSVTADGYIGRYLEYYRLHYHQALKSEYEKDILSTLAVWLQLEDPPLFEPGATVNQRPRSSYQAGKSYWMFGSPLPGILCRPGAKWGACEDNIAQFQTHDRFLGHCFDMGGSMYIGDQSSSLLMKVAQDPTQQVETNYGAFRTTSTGQGPPKSIRYERRNCPCLKNWIDWEDLGLSKPVMSQFPDAGNLKPQQLCTENPAILSQINLPDFMKKPCTVTDFCSSEQVPWCFVDADGGSAGSYCTDTTGGDAELAGRGYCQLQGEHEITFKAVSGASILGNEMRKNMRCAFKGPLNTRLPKLKSDIQWYDRQVKKMYACDFDYDGVTEHKPPYNVLPWSQLLGFELPDDFAKVAYGEATWSNMTTVASISSTCEGNGLTTRQDTDGVRTYCAVESTQDFDKLIEYGNMMSATPTWPGLDALSKERATNWFGIILVWSSPRVFSDPNYCAERCRIDRACKAYITSPYQIERAAQSDGPQSTTVTTTTGLFVPMPAGGYTCMLYSETWPYSVYVHNRSDAATFINTPDKPSNIPFDKWSSPISPVMRMFNFNYSSDTAGINNAYINTHLSVIGATKGLISGPHPDKSLLLGECKAACLAQTAPNCTSIAFPGCYLFDNTFNWTKQDPPPARTGTTVFIKEYTSMKVSRTTGAPGVYAFSDNMNGGNTGVRKLAEAMKGGNPAMAMDSLINRPGGCAFNTQGSLFFADTWNHRVRTISKMHVECQYNMELFTTAAVNTYRNLINDVDRQCFTNTSAPFKGDAHKPLQQSVVQKREMLYYEQMLCKFLSPASAGLPTQNLVALCVVCAEIANRDDLGGCPSRELCNCRDSIVKVLSSEVYLNCPSPSAYYEKWHRFISAYVICWFSQGVDDAHFLNDVGKQTLKKALLTTLKPATP